MSFTKTVSLNFYDFAVPFSIGALDGLIRRAPAVKCGIEFSLLHAVKALAQQILEMTIINPLSSAGQWKASTSRAVRNLNAATVHAGCIITCVALGCLSKVTVLILGAIMIQSLISELSFAYQLRARGY